MIHFFYSTPLIHVLAFYKIVDAQVELNVTLITVIKCEGTRLVLIENSICLSFFLYLKSTFSRPLWYSFTFKIFELLKM